jgi:hypothetical protein
MFVYIPANPTPAGGSADTFSIIHLSGRPTTAALLLSCAGCPDQPTARATCHGLGPPTHQLARSAPRPLPHNHRCLIATSASSSVAPPSASPSAPSSAPSSASSSAPPPARTHKHSVPRVHRGYLRSWRCCWQQQQLSPTAGTHVACQLAAGAAVAQAS